MQDVIEAIINGADDDKHAAELILKVVGTEARLLAEVRRTSDDMAVFLAQAEDDNRRLWLAVVHLRSAYTRLSGADDPDDLAAGEDVQIADDLLSNIITLERAQDDVCRTPRLDQSRHGLV